MRGHGSGGGATLQLRVPPEPRFGRLTRERVAQFTADHCIPEADAEAFLTAVSEALANAIEHSGTPTSIEVSCRLTGRRLVATVVDDGVGFASEVPGEPVLPDPLAERGRGLPIMRRLTDHFEVRSTPGAGTSVILERMIRRSAESEDDDDIAS
ncbi:MAG: ATP-binding protein [Candidatus Eremiobacteraeota bacterium]|nr:ATP-binding protein [Candidatus Eremiobacteraeota bacterium]